MTSFIEKKAELKNFDGKKLCLATWNFEKFF